MSYGYPKGLETGSPLFSNTYECECGNVWDDIWDCGVDDDCASCGATCSPSQSDDITPAFTFETVEPAALRVGDLVEGNGALWRILARDVPAGGRSVVSALSPAMIEVECVNTRDVDAFYIGFRKQFAQTPKHSAWTRVVL